MKIFLKMKHWQLFILLIGIPIIFQLAGFTSLYTTSNAFMMLYGFPVMMILFFGVFFNWFYALGNNLHKKLPETVEMNLVKFKLFIFIPLLYMILIFVYIFGLFSPSSGGEIQDPKILAVIIPLHLFSMYCMFYSLYFNAKSLKSVELQRPVTFNDYAEEFFMMWIFFIGVWLIQPRINKIFEETNEI